MEKIQTATLHNSESSLLITCVNKSNIDELSKEKEEELLFGGEDEGDDEDALSDDSLRLRLSDDEDAEQENITANDTNIVQLKSQNVITEQTCIEVIKEKPLRADLQETIEQNLDHEELVQKKHNPVPENSALSSDKYTSKNEQVQDNMYNSENITVIVNESNENCILNSDNLNITSVSNAYSSLVSKKNNELENNNLSINNRTYASNIQNKELTIHNKENLRKIANNGKNVIPKNICDVNELDNTESNISSIESVNVKICKNEKLSTIVVVNNNNSNNNLGNKLINKHIKNNDNSLECSSIELNTASDLNESDDSKELLSHKDIAAPENKNPDIMNIIEIENTSNTSKSTEELTNIHISSIKNQNDSSNAKDKAEIINKDQDINKCIGNITSQNLLVSNNDNSSDNQGKTENINTIVQRRKRSKKTINNIQDHVEEGKQGEKESGRQKRKTAKNAEEIIRKKYLNSDSDSTDSTEDFVIVNHKVNRDTQSTSPSSLKRNCSENENFNNNFKKAKMNTQHSKEKKDVTQLSFVEKFFRRDIKERLPKLTQEELEELLIQKIVETIAMRSEIGQLREQARISERYQETIRAKMQQLMKQVKDFEMVLNRNAIDRRANPDKLVAPIKINRSVGLQVSFITEHGIQNLRQANLKPTTSTTNSNNSSSPVKTNNNGTNSNQKRQGGIKTRSPRSATVPVSTAVVTQNHSVQGSPIISNVTPAALVVAKPLETSHTLTLSNQPTNVQPILPNPQQPMSSQSMSSQPTIILNGKIQNQVNRPPLIAPKPRNSDLIDLTDEEEKNKLGAKAKTSTPIIEQLNATSKSAAQSFQRVIQTIPANVAITTQPTSIKVITNQQPVSTALVNNVNSPRLAYVMQSGTGSPRQVLIASNSNQPVQIRPMSSPNRPPFPTVTYKGVSTIANGVRVLATPVLSNIQISKHPAPLPDIPTYAATPGWKLPPPAPSLKISKVSNGIVLSWNMNLTDKYAEIASYQLYAYQEVAGMNPNTSLWKKVGDVRALPLPMACTLTQFSEGNNYYFAVRAVDTHSRKGQYSIPGNISL